MYVPYHSRDRVDTDVCSYLYYHHHHHNHHAMPYAIPYCLCLHHIKSEYQMKSTNEPNKPHT